MAASQLPQGLAAASLSPHKCAPLPVAVKQSIKAQAWQDQQACGMQSLKLQEPTQEPYTAAARLRRLLRTSCTKSAYHSLKLQACHA